MYWFFLYFVLRFGPLSLIYVPCVSCTELSPSVVEDTVVVGLPSSRSFIALGANTPSASNSRVRRYLDQPPIKSHANPIASKPKPNKLEALLNLQTSTKRSATKAGIKRVLKKYRLAHNGTAHKRTNASPEIKEMLKEVETILVRNHESTNKSNSNIAIVDDFHPDAKNGLHTEISPSKSDKTNSSNYATKITAATESQDFTNEEASSNNIMSVKLDNSNRTDAPKSPKSSKLENHAVNLKNKKSEERKKGNDTLGSNHQNFTQQELGEEARKLPVDLKKNVSQIKSKSIEKLDAALESMAEDDQIAESGKSANIIQQQELKRPESNATDSENTNLQKNTNQSIPQEASASMVVSNAKRLNKTNTTSQQTMRYAETIVTGSGDTISQRESNKSTIHVSGSSPIEASKEDDIENRNTSSQEKISRAENNVSDSRTTASQREANKSMAQVTSAPIAVPHKRMNKTGNHITDNRNSSLQRLTESENGVEDNNTKTNLTQHEQPKTNISEHHDLAKKLKTKMAQSSNCSKSVINSTTNNGSIIKNTDYRVQNLTLGSTTNGTKRLGIEPLLLHTYKTGICTELQEYIPQKTKTASPYKRDFAPSRYSWHHHRSAIAKYLWRVVMKRSFVKHYCSNVDVSARKKNALHQNLHRKPNKIVKGVGRSNITYDNDPSEAQPLTATDDTTAANRTIKKGDSNQSTSNNTRSCDNTNHGGSSGEIKDGNATKHLTGNGISAADSDADVNMVSNGSGSANGSLVEKSIMARELVEELVDHQLSSIGFEQDQFDDDEPGDSGESAKRDRAKNRYAAKKPRHETEEYSKDQKDDSSIKHSIRKSSQSEALVTATPSIPNDSEDVSKHDIIKHKSPILKVELLKPELGKKTNMTNDSSAMELNDEDTVFDTQPIKKSQPRQLNASQAVIPILIPVQPGIFSPPKAKKKPPTALHDDDHDDEDNPFPTKRPPTTHTASPQPLIPQTTLIPIPKTPSIFHPTTRVTDTTVHYNLHSTEIPTSRYLLYDETMPTRHHTRHTRPHMRGTRHTNILKVHPYMTNQTPPPRRTLAIRSTPRKTTPGRTTARMTTPRHRARGPTIKFPPHSTRKVTTQFDLVALKPTRRFRLTPAIRIVTVPPKLRLPTLKPTNQHHITVMFNCPICMIRRRRG